MITCDTYIIAGPYAGRRESRISAPWVIDRIRSPATGRDCQARDDTTANTTIKNSVTNSSRDECVSVE